MLCTGKDVLWVIYLDRCILSQSLSLSDLDELRPQRFVVVVIPKVQPRLGGGIIYAVILDNAVIHIRRVQYLI